MRILLTGATGLLGQKIGLQLVASGHSLMVLARSPQKAVQELPFPCEVYKWDSTQLVPPDVLQGIDGVIHLAGDSIADGRWTDKKKKSIRVSRVEGTKNLVQSLLNAKCQLQVFVAASASGYYGSCGDEVLSEGKEAGDDFLAKVVKDWEHEVARLSSTRVVNIRIAMVLSRQGGALAKMKPVFSKGLGGRLGSGQQWMSWIHIEDIVRLFVWALENKNVQGPINGGAPEPVRNQDFTQALAKACGSQPFMAVPTTALRLLIGEMADVVLSSQRLASQKVRSLGFEFHHPTLAEALADVCQAERVGQHEVVYEQWVPRKVEDVFSFFANENNLAVLTPPFLSFQVLGKSTEHIENGTLIDYRLSLHGLPLRWQSRIEDWQEGRRFVDIQTKGPYQYWHHTHEFVPLAGGTLLRDRILYKVPLGELGDLAAGWKVFNDVQGIFAYRKQKIGELFEWAGTALPS